VMLQQDEEQQQSMINKSISPCVMLSDQMYIQHRNVDDNTTYNEQIKQLSDTSLNDIGNIYGKTSDEKPNNNITCVHSKNTNAYAPCQSIKDNFITAQSESEANCVNDKSYGKCMTIEQKRTWDSSSYAQKRRAQELMNIQKPRHDDLSYWRDIVNANKQNSSNRSVDYELNKLKSPNHENKMHDYLPSRNIGMIKYFKNTKLIKNDKLNIPTKLVS